ncbi:alanine aminotransferase [Musa troglodytarum]|uniref:Alanine aminotransferase n=1 Tax=Musa troglodytarum TaxID=320322 RepID=A0A9E7HD47_9LILI|nr:alanine aminotransferase [Musa troglodytarum]
MVGSGVGGDSRSKEAVGMLALHEALRNVCLNSDWTYSVFWTIRPRPRCRGGNGCKVGDDNGNLMLMWEDGFCRTRVDDIDGEDQVRKAFSKMSIQLYNYGEGWVLGRLMGKVASDKCHKWVFKEPSECEPNIANYWQSSFDATIAVIQAGHGLLQLGSCNIIPEDLHFVLRMRHMFESLGYQSGFFLSQLFSSSRNSSPSPSAPVKQIPARPPPPVFNWSHPSLASNPPIASPAYHPSAQMGLPSNKDDTQLYLLPPSSEAQMDEMMPEQESDLKWPNGLSFFTALTGRTDDAKLLFGAEMLGHQPPPHPHPLMAARKNLTASSPVSICGNADELKAIEASGLPGQGNIGDSGTALSASNTEDLLSLESHSGRARKMENSKFKRSFTLPARMTTSSSSSSLDHHHASTPQPMDYRGSEAGFCLDIMETFLD